MTNLIPQNLLIQVINLDRRPDRLAHITTELKKVGLSFEKQTAVEKLKSIATQKVMTVNNKFVSQYTVPFYGKIILFFRKNQNLKSIIYRLCGSET